MLMASHAAAGSLSLRGMVSRTVDDRRCAARSAGERRNLRASIPIASIARCVDGTRTLNTIGRWEGAPAAVRFWPANATRHCIPHRLSARAQPVARSVTTGSTRPVSFGRDRAFADRWKIEASAFNGREPDEDRTNVDLANLNSVGRVVDAAAAAAVPRAADCTMRAAARRERTDVDA
jgi:hypothetical protein